MNAEQLNLIESELRSSVTLVCDTMLGGGIETTGAASSPRTVGRIHVTGDLAFTVELSMPDPDAALIASALLGMPVGDDEALVTDAFGEFTNLVVGSAKSKLTGHDCNLSVPEVSHTLCEGQSLRKLDASSSLSLLQIDIHPPLAA